MLIYNFRTQILSFLKKGLSFYLLKDNVLPIYLKKHNTDSIINLTFVMQMGHENSSHLNILVLYFKTKQNKMKKQQCTSLIEITFPQCPTTWDRNHGNGMEYWSKPPG